MKTFFLFLITIFLFQPNSFSQTIESENVYDFPPGMKNPELVNVYYDEIDKSVNLRFFRDNTVTQTEWTDMSFDSLQKPVQFSTEQIDYTKDVYLAKLFPGYQGKEFNISGYNIKENYKGITLSSGEIYARKVNYHYKWNWLFRDYIFNYDVTDEVMLPKSEGKKYFPISSWFNSKTGDLFALIAYQKSGAITMLAKDGQVYTSNYKIFKISPDFQITEIASLDFDYTQFVHFKAIIPYNRSCTQINAYSYPNDLRFGDLMLVFSPARGMVPHKDPNKGNYTFLCMNGAGQIEFNTNISLPQSKWEIEGAINKGNDFYFWGPSQHNTSRWKNFQLLKLSNGQLSYATTNYWKDFNTTIVKSSNQLLKHGYHGKNFIPLVVAVSDQGEFFYGGQNFKVTKSGETFYKHLLVAQFNSEGKVEASYGFKTDRMYLSKHYKASLNLYFGKSSEKIFVEIGNYHSAIGIHQGSTVGNYLLGPGPYRVQFNYYPNITGINVVNKTLINTVSPGMDARGHHRYFINAHFPVIQVPEENKLIYVGNDLYSKQIWIAKVVLE